jgi:polyhydroxybutyrate depolymerase
MRAGLRACTAALGAAAALSAAGCTLTNAAAEASRRASPHAAAQPSPAKPAATPSQAQRKLPAGMRRLTVHGRLVYLFVPRHLRQPAPLVVGLGGIGSTAQNEITLFKLTGVASRSGAVVAYPDPVDGTWNAGGCCWGAKANDVAFLSWMRSAIARLVPLDPNQQVLLGFSNGGMLGYDAACADRHWTAVIAFGASLTTRCNPSHAFSITNVNGTLDNVAPWNGGWSNYTRTTMPPVWKIDQEFAGVFGCRQFKHRKSSGDTIYTYSACQNGVFVRDIRVPGMLHHWATKKQDGYDMGPVLWQLTGL